MDIGSAATITVNVELEGADEAKASVVDLGAKGEAGAHRFQQAFVTAQQLASQAAKQTQNAVEALTAILAEQVRVTTAEAAAEKAATAARRESTRAAREAREAKAAQLRLGQEMAQELEARLRFESADRGALNINKIGNALENMAGAALGASGPIENIASELLQFGAGGTVAVAVLAGIAAISFAWNKLSEGSHKAAEEQKKLTDALKDWYETEKLGVGGERVRQLEAQHTAVKALADEYARLKGLAEDTQKAEQKAGATGTTALFNQYAGGIGSTNAFFQQEAGGVGSTTAFFSAQANGANAAAAAIAKKTAKEIEDAAALDLLLQRTLALIDAEAQRLHYLELLTASIPSIEKVAVSFSGLTAQLLANNKAATATSDIWQQMRGNIKAADLPDTGQKPGAWLFELPQSTKYTDIWRDGINKIITDGTKSFHDFFEDVLQMFTRLIDRMQQAGKGGSIGAKLLGLGSAALGGGLAGYQTGQSIGSAGMGALGGAAAGALAGSAFGPWGAVIGGLAGLTGGLIGGAKAARERAAAEDQLRQSLASSLEQMRALAGTSTPLAVALKQNAEAFAALRKQAEEAYSGRKNEAEREKILREITTLEATRAQQITEEAAKEAARAAEDAAEQIRQLAQAMADAAAEAAEARRLMLQSATQDYRLRYLTAIGDSDAAFYYRQQLEYSEAIAKDLDAATLTWLRMAQAAEADAYEQQKADAEAQKAQQAQTEALQQQQRTLEQQLNAQQEIVNNTRQTIDALRKYSESLLLGNLTPLGPEARYQEAKRQYLATANLAAGGDLTAAGNLPGVANAFLEQSRNMFASSQRYADDFRMVQTFVGSLIDQYGAALSVEERMLAQLQQQNAALLEQINAQRETTGAVRDNTRVFTEGVIPLLRDPPWLDKLRDDLINRPPGTDPPTGRPRTPPSDRIRTNELLTGIHSFLSSMDAKSFVQLDVIGRTHGIISAHLPTQTEYQRQTKDNTKATSDGVNRLRPIDVGGTVH